MAYLETDDETRRAVDDINRMREKLKAFIRQHQPFVCRMFSGQVDCDCLLCCVDRLAYDALPEKAKID